MTAPSRESHRRAKMHPMSERKKMVHPKEGGSNGADVITDMGSNEMGERRKSHHLDN